MAGCEKCWRDSSGDPTRYLELLEAETCTPEQQAGPDATECPNCKRRTVHQYAKVCMVAVCGWRPQ